MRTKKETLFTAVVNTLCAGLWWFAAVRDGAQELEPICALVWTVVAVLWWRRYGKARRAEQD